MTETILSIFSVYGAPALFVIVAAGQFGVPLPTSILLLTAGALQANGDLSFWQIFSWALAGAVTGDHVGYATDSDKLPISRGVFVISAEFLFAGFGIGGHRISSARLS